MSEIIRLSQGQPWAGPRLPADQVPALVAIAGRAPSILNTQPWLFRVAGNAVELHADPGRALRLLDPAGRELMISCGAALYGLRLAVRRLGYVPAVSLRPDPARPALLAQVYLGAPAPMTGREWGLLAAVPHRYTHRGPFSPGPLPDGLLAGLQHDAIAEGAALALVGEPPAFQRLARLAAAAGTWRRRAAQAEIRRWTRPPGSTARDGVAAGAYPASAPEPDLGETGRLAQRDFDLGRGWGSAGEAGAPAAATAILTTAADTPQDWLRAGQALQRMLLHAATTWVFASMNSEPLELSPIRALVRSGLGLAGTPQMLLQFGRVHTAAASARRPASDLLQTG